MEVKQRETGKTGIFYIEDNGEKVAVLTYYTEDENKLVIEHTVVNPGNEGKGLGKALVNAVAAFAKEKNLKIVPVCSYAKMVMERSDAYNDVLFKG